MPAYLRGEAYLLAHRGQEAAAHVGLARACAIEGDKAKAKAAYQDFFTLWKNADPDIPILKQAQAEYARLQ